LIEVKCFKWGYFDFRNRCLQGQSVNWQATLTV
jgi:hypothetical protein